MEKGRLLKKSVTCLAIIFIFVFSSFNLAQVSACKKSDLVGSWNFEEGEGLIAQDSSINGNDGVLCAGRFENALRFDGINDYVEVSDHASLRLQELSVEAWIRLDSDHGMVTILEKPVNSEAESYSLQVNAANQVVFTVRNKVENKFASWQTTSSDFSPIQNDVWVHVAATYRNQFGAAEDGRIFIHNYEDPSVTFSSNSYDSSFSIEYSSEPLLIGIGHGQHNAFAGIIDEVRISNVDRNIVEPQFFFSRYIQTPLDAYTAGLWHFDEGSGDTVHEETDIDNFGTIQGASWLSGPTWVDGPFGKALQFDGVDDHIVVPDSPSLHVTGQLTIELWAYAYTFQGIPVVINKQYGESYYLQFVGESVEFGFGGIFFSTSPLPVIHTGSWFHIAGTINEETDTITIYVNGNVVKTATDMTVPISVSVRPLVIGGSGGGNEWHFNGILDEIQIWNRALSANEIKKHANELPKEKMPVKFKDKFNNEKLKDWNVVFGTWSVQNGKLAQNDPSQGGDWYQRPAIVANCIVGENFRIETEFNHDLGGSVAILFRYQDMGNTLFIIFHGGTHIIIGSAVDGAEIGNVWYPFSFSYDAKYQITIEVHGPEIDVYVDGVLAASNPDLGSAYSSGKVGFHTTGTAVTYDDVVVSELKTK